MGQEGAAEAPPPPSEPRQDHAADSVSSDSSLTGASEDSGSKPANKTNSQPKTPGRTKATKKIQKAVEHTEDFDDNPSQKCQPGQAPSELVDKQRRPPKPVREKARKRREEENGKMRDIANSILSRRNVDSPTAADSSNDPNKPRWLHQKEVLKKKFPNGWEPRKKLSPDALAGIRALNAQFPDVYNVPSLSAHFKVSPENIRRILRSKWQPSPDEAEDRERRWFNRGKNIWETKAAMGFKPPKKWREEGITRDPSHHIRRQHGIQRERQIDEEETEAYRAYRQRLAGKQGGGSGSG